MPPRGPCGAAYGTWEVRPQRLWGMRSSGNPSFKKNTRNRPPKKRPSAAALRALSAAPFRAAEPTPAVPHRSAARRAALRSRCANELKALSCANAAAPNPGATPIPSAPGSSSDTLRKSRSQRAQIFALFVQNLFFFLCGSGRVPIKVVFPASLPCSTSALFFFFLRARFLDRRCV